ncbi:MAG: hypothetical protein NVS3B20_14460 [Polyangiales bacterium]
MDRNLIIYIVLCVAFAAWCTVHVALSVGLLRRRPRWRGPVGFLVLPLAPVFGLIEKLRIRSALWLLFAAIYGIFFWIAR